MPEDGYRWRYGGRLGTRFFYTFMNRRTQAWNHFIPQIVLFCIHPKYEHESSKTQSSKKRYENYITKQHSESLQFTEWEFTEAEIIELVEKTMEKLPPRCREVFCLSRFEGKNNATIAEMLGISKRTVELQISNALKILRTELKNYGL